MHRTENISNAFLAVDRAESVFELFFIFLRDDGSGVQEEQTFESAAREIIGGVYIPEEALERIRVIYHRSTQSPPALYDSATRLKELLSNERPLLVIVFSVLLRLAMDEGMMCRGDRERLYEVFRIFMFTAEEIDLLPDELQRRLESFICSHVHHPNFPSTRSLAQHFETLECAPDSSHQEIRSSYRRLVKKHHPDRHSPSNPNAVAHRRQFQKVQTAYEAITRASSKSTTFFFE